MKKFVKSILLVLNICSALLLIGCYSAAFITPVKFSVLGLLSLSYPYLLLANIIFIGFWLCFWKKYFLISLIVILIRVDYLPAFFQISNKQEGTELENKLRIMTFNVHAFAYGSNDKQPQIEKTVELIRQWKPDIVCMQEFSGKKKDKFNSLSSIKDCVGEYYYSPLESKKGDIGGNIVFSRFPIINQGIVDSSLKYKYKLMFIDIVTDYDTLRVYNIHLASFKLDDNDAKILDDFTENQNIEKEKGKTLIRKLVRAQREHAKETDILKKHISTSPYKVIICGDFNDTPSSYAYRQLRSGLKDAFTQKGSGFGTTYNGPFPAFRIDYILHNKSYKTVSFKLEKSDISDHLPVFSVLEKTAIK